MRTKKLKIIFLLLVGILFSLPARAEEYHKTITVLQQGQVIPVEEFHLTSLLESELSRVRVKNGGSFFVKLPKNPNIRNLMGGVLEGENIRVENPGTLRFFFTKNGEEKKLYADVNYFGVLQYQGSDAPETIEVNEGNQTEKVYFPPQINGTRWFGVEKDGKLNHLSEVPDGTSEATLGLLKNSGFTKFRVRNRDGTSNELPDGKPGGESWCEFSIKIQPQTYSVSLTAQPSEGGTVSGAGNYNENSSVTVSASPASGWRFVKWTENGSEVSTSSSYSFTLTSDRNLVAHFEQIPVQQYSVSLTAQPSEGGTVSGAGNYNENSSVTVSASPASGWRFVKWTENDQEVSTSASYKFTITRNRNLVAVFERIPVTTYSVSLSAQPAEGGQVSGGGTFNENTEVTVSASPASGWRFVKWTENDQEVSTSASYKFTITRNRNLVAVFERIPVTPPTSFNILKIYQRDAIISWQAGSHEVEWEIQYSDRKVIVTEPRLTLRRLEPNTDYTIEVRAKVEGQLSEPLKGSLKTEGFSEKHNRLPHLYGMKDVFTLNETLPVFWKDLEKLPKKISYSLSPLSTSTSEKKKNKIFLPLPEVIHFSEKGTFILTLRFEGHDECEEDTFLIEVK